MNFCVRSSFFDKKRTFRFPEKVRKMNKLKGIDKNSRNNQEIPKNLLFGNLFMQNYHGEKQNKHISKGIDDRAIF